jgi:hypothetical protein
MKSKIFLNNFSLRRRAGVFIYNVFIFEHEFSDLSFETLSFFSKMANLHLIIAGFSDVAS